MEDFIARKMKEQLHLFPAVGGFEWETFFREALKQAYNAGIARGEEYERTSNGIQNSKVH